MWMTCLAVKVDRRKATSLCRRCRRRTFYHPPCDLRVISVDGRLLEPQQSLMPRTPGTGFWIWDWSNRHGESTHLTDPGEAASDMPPLAAPQDEVLPVFPAFVCVGRFTVVSPEVDGFFTDSRNGFETGFRCDARYHLKGACQFGASCSFAHSCAELQVARLLQTQFSWEFTVDVQSVCKNNASSKIFFCKIHLSGLWYSLCYNQIMYDKLTFQTYPSNWLNLDKGVSRQATPDLRKTRLCVNFFEGVELGDSAGNLILITTPPVA